MERVFWSTLVRHFVPSAKELSLNSTITQVGSSHRRCLGPSLCTDHISFTIPIDQIMSLYALSSLVNNMTIQPTYNAVSFEKSHYFKQ